jgi:hypothetical protein
MQIRCTHKLLKELGARDDDLMAVEKPDSTLGNWYANIFTVDRRKTIIFVNERTLLSFVAYGIQKDNIKNFPVIFLSGLAQVLAMEGINEDIIKKVLDEYSDIFLTKTDSKKVLGNMTDLVWLYSDFILSDGGFENIDLLDIISRINKVPQRNIAWQYSIEATKEILNITHQ